MPSSFLPLPPPAMRLLRTASSSSATTTPNPFCKRSCGPNWCASWKTTQKTCRLTLDQLVQWAAAMLSHEYAQGGVTTHALDFVLRLNSSSEDERRLLLWRPPPPHTTWEAWCQDLFGNIQNTKKTTAQWTAAVHAFDIAWNCLSSQSSSQQHMTRRLLLPALERHVRDLYRFMPARYREYYLRLQQQQQSVGKDLLGKNSTMRRTIRTSRIRPLWWP